jgi:hypothetical protein
MHIKQNNMNNNCLLSRILIRDVCLGFIKMLSNIAGYINNEKYSASALERKFNVHVAR